MGEPSARTRELADASNDLDEAVDDNANAEDRAKRAAQALDDGRREAG